MVLKPIVNSHPHNLNRSIQLEGVKEQINTHSHTHTVRPTGGMGEKEREVEL